MKKSHCTSGGDAPNHPEHSQEEGLGSPLSCQGRGRVTDITDVPLLSPITKPLCSIPFGELQFCCVNAFSATFPTCRAKLMPSTLHDGISGISADKACYATWASEISVYMATCTGYCCFHWLCEYPTRRCLEGPHKPSLDSHSHLPCNS